MVKNLSTIALVVLFLGSIVTLGITMFGGSTIMPTSSGTSTVSVPDFLEVYMGWIYGVVGLAILLLILFAFKTLFTDLKGAIGGLIGMVLFVGLLAVCYFLSGETEDFVRVVNGESQTIELFWMKAIDMWCYSIYALIGITVLLIIVFPILRAINIIK